MAGWACLWMQASEARQLQAIASRRGEVLLQASRPREGTRSGFLRAGMSMLGRMGMLADAGV